MKYNERNKITSLWKFAAISSLALAFSIAALPASAQNPDSLPGYPVASGQASTNSSTAQNSAPQESNTAGAAATASDGGAARHRATERPTGRASATL